MRGSTFAWLAPVALPLSLPYSAQRPQVYRGPTSWQALFVRYTDKPSTYNEYLVSEMRGQSPQMMSVVRFHKGGETVPFMAQRQTRF
jgi:hypothetical protein